MNPQHNDLVFMYRQNYLYVFDVIKFHTHISFIGFLENSLSELLSRAKLYLNILIHITLFFQNIYCLLVLYRDSV